MKLPQDMSQVASDIKSVRDYTIILPVGSYTSGTYTIPDGRTWDDFKMIVGVMGGSSSRVMAPTLLDEQISSTGWTAEMLPWGSECAGVQWTSATTFTVSQRTGLGDVKMLIGYLK